MFVQVRLYDHRLIQRGAVQTYDGHANSHTRIQLGVDPTETFVASGTIILVQAQYFYIQKSRGYW